MRTSRRMGRRRDGGVATALPGRRCSALSVSLWQRAGGGRGGGGGGRDAAGAYDEFARPRLEHNSLRFRGQLREFLRECAAADVEVTMYDAGEARRRAEHCCTPLSSGPCTSSSGCARACERGGPDRRTGRSPQALGCGLLGVGIRFSFGWLPGAGICIFTWVRARLAGITDVTCISPPRLHCGMHNSALQEPRDAGAGERRSVFLDYTVAPTARQVSVLTR